MKTKPARLTKDSRLSEAQKAPGLLVLVWALEFLLFAPLDMLQAHPRHPLIFGNHCYQNHCCHPIEIKMKLMKNKKTYQFLILVLIVVFIVTSSRSTFHLLLYRARQNWCFFVCSSMIILFFPIRVFIIASLGKITCLCPSYRETVGSLIFGAGKGLFQIFIILNFLRCWGHVSFNSWICYC